MPTTIKKTTKTVAKKPAKAVAKKTVAKKIIKPIPKALIKSMPIVGSANGFKTVKPVFATPEVSFGMPNLHKEFVSGDKADYSYCLGSTVASAFSGFIAGIVVAALIFIVVINVYYTAI